LPKALVGLASALGLGVLTAKGTAPPKGKLRAGKRGFLKVPVETGAPDKRSFRDWGSEEEGELVEGVPPETPGAFPYPVYFTGARGVDIVINLR